MDLLTYSEELTFEWKGKQVIYSHTWEVALLFCIIWFRGSPSSWAWGTMPVIQMANRYASALGVYNPERVTVIYADKKRGGLQS